MSIIVGEIIATSKLGIFCLKIHASKEICLFTTFKGSLNKLLLYIRDWSLAYKETDDIPSVSNTLDETENSCINFENFKTFLNNKISE